MFRNDSPFFAQFHLSRPIPVRDERMRLNALHDYMEKQISSIFKNKAGMTLASLAAGRGAELDSFEQDSCYVRSKNAPSSDARSPSSILAPSSKAGAPSSFLLLVVMASNLIAMASTVWFLNSMCCLVPGCFRNRLSLLPYNSVLLVKVAGQAGRSG